MKDIDYFGIPKKFLENIHTTEQMCDELNVSLKQLLYLCHANKSKIYTEFTIKKKNGKARVITAPRGDLKNIQKRIASGLRQYYKKPCCVCGFEPKTSVRTNAENHVGKRYLINIDLSDFFNHITIKRVIGLFAKIFDMDYKLCVMLAQLVTANGVLPTGGPSSPIISNMIFYRVDKAILNYVRGKNISYSRYADDLSFSFNEKKYLKLFFSDDGKLLQSGFEQIFINNDFSINYSKVRLQTSHMHQQVTGIKVNKLLNLSKYYKYYLRFQLHLIKKYGLDSVTKCFCQKRNICFDKQSYSKYLNHLSGKISFWKMVKGDCDESFVDFATQFNNIVDKRTINIYPPNFKILFDRSILLAAYQEGDSATAFYYRGYVITCLHCLDILKKDNQTGDTIFLSDPIDRNEIRTKYITGSSENFNDFAIYKPYTNDFIEIRQSKKKEIKIGDKVKIIGYPYSTNGKVLKPSLYESIVCNKQLDENGRPIFIVNAPIQQGLSGGPVLDDEDCVIGYVVWGSKDLISSCVTNGFMPISNIDNAINSIIKTQIHNK